MDMLTSFLGTGWKFPIQFTKTTGNVEMVSDEDDIQSSLKILLSTRIGDRIMEPEFGCNTDSMIIEIMSTGYQTFMQHQIKEAILLYENRNVRC